MMYRMKNIISYDDDITLPKCMYTLKNPNEVRLQSEPMVDVNIRSQVMKFLKVPNNKMAELEKRQDNLLKKLDMLYDRIKTISSYCSTQSSPQPTTKSDVSPALSTPEEIVVALSPDNLPWYLNFFLKKSPVSMKISSHVHSSVPNEKVAKINSFIKKLKTTDNNAKVHLRLIFRSGSADPELKLSALSVPVVGNVNILRYLACVYPNILSYNSNDYQMDSLLDMCHLLERTPDKARDGILKKLFAEQKEWIYNNNPSIIDVAAYNIVKQWQNTKSVPKKWFDNCEKMCS